MGGRGHKDDLEYTADGLRDMASARGQAADEDHIQASMQEETAKAIHRLADAVERLADAAEDDEHRLTGAKPEAVPEDAERDEDGEAAFEAEVDGGDD